jgi:hypothetical protein
MKGSDWEASMLLWPESQVPEFRDLPTDQRRDVWLKCDRQAFKHWQVWAVLLAFFAIAPFALWWAWLLASRDHSLFGVVIAAVVGIGGLLLPRCVKAPFLIKHLRAELRKKGLLK